MTRGRDLLALAAVCVAAGPALIARTSSLAQPADAVTFTKQIAPLLIERCAGCHHPDGPAPFSLLAYTDVRPRARSIAAVTQKRLMPPWKSKPGFGEFIGQQHLTDEEIELIERWVADGAPRGEPADLPPQPRWTGSWQLGTPDLVVALATPYTVPGNGPDFSRTFVLPLPVSGVRYVEGFEFRPGNSGAVHHANIRIDRTPASRRLDEEDPEPGYEGLLLPSAVYPDGFFLGWTPGQVAPLLPKGLAWRLNPGTDLVVEMHFVPSGTPQSVQPSVALYFTDESPERTPAMLRLGRQNIDIPAGQADYVTTDSFVLPVDVEVIAVQPHAHYRAREIRGTATLPDGTSTPLIYIDDWDYHWQHVYRYEAPLHFPKGTTLSMRFTFDNSIANQRNPHQPPARVRWGQRSTDEMGDLWIQMLTRNARDLRVLNERIGPKHAAEEIVGYEMRIQDDPSDISLHNDVALLYKDLGQLDKSVAHFRTVVGLAPTSAASHYNLGTALLGGGKPNEAIEELRQALRFKPDYVAAHNNLGNALLRIGNPDEALHSFREALRLDPKDGDAYFNIGSLMLSQGRSSDALFWFRETSRRQPDEIEPLTNLAWVLATLPESSGESADEAMRLADRAAELTEQRNAGVLNVLAAAQAAAGKFDQAIATCDAALALAPDEPSRARIRAHQRQYEQHRRVILPQTSR